MRNILLTGSLLLCINIVNAQFQKGQKLIGGQIGFSSGLDAINSSGDRTYNTSFYLNPSLSKFKSSTVVNGFGITYQYGYNHSHVDDPTQEQRSYQNSIGVFVNKTRLLPLVRKLDLALTGTGGLNYTFGKLNHVSLGSGSIDIQAITPYLSGSLGVWYQLGERLLLTCDLTNLVSMSYTYTKTLSNGTTVDEKRTSNRFNFNAGLSGTNLNGLAIGIRYVLK